MVDTKPIKGTTDLAGFHVDEHATAGGRIDCPICESTYCHSVGFHEDQKGEYDSWEGRGGIRSIKMECENCEGTFYLSVGFHKGQSTLHFRIPKTQKHLRVTQP